MTIVDFRNYKEEKEERLERKSQAARLRKILAEADTRRFTDTNYDPCAPFTEEQKANARRRYREEVKQYRKDMRAYSFAMARYEQGLSDERPRLPLSIPFKTFENVMLEETFKSDAEYLEWRKQIDEWWASINRPLSEWPEEE